MSCRQYRDSVVLFADGELTEDAAHEVQSHLAGCDACRDSLAELRRLEGLLTPDTPENPTVAESRFWRSFDADLALRVNREALPFWRRAVFIPMPAAVAMSVVMVSLGTMVVHERRTNERLAVKNAHLTATLKSVRDEGVLSFSPKLVESLARLDSIHVEEDWAALPEVEDLESKNAEARVAATAVPQFTQFTRSGTRRPAMAKMPAPHATPDLPAGMEIRFIDSQLGAVDMY